MRLLVLTAVLGGCSFQPSPGTDGNPGRPDSGGGSVADAATGGRADAPTTSTIDAASPATTIRIEAESWSAMVPGPGGVVWTVGTSLSGFTGTGYALGPNRGCTPTSLPCGAIAVYDFVVATTASYRVVLRHAAIDEAQDSVWWGIDLVVNLDTPTIEDLNPEVGPGGTWVDDRDASVVSLGAGAHKFSLFLREASVPVDHIKLVPQ
ncbi:MAG: hypothetical protein KBG28_23480 [Kofleriaceae bacterium]|nr:hypothetical protein [Kofleriaceae bacterium]